MKSCVWWEEVRDAREVGGGGYVKWKRDEGVCGVGGSDRYQGSKYM